MSPIAAFSAARVRFSGICKSAGKSSCIYKLVIGCALLLTSGQLFAASAASGSAYGLSVDARLSLPVGPEARATAGPAPEVSASAPPDYAERDTTATASAGLPDGALGVATQVLTAEISSNLAGNRSDAAASVDGLQSSVAGVFGLTADVVTSSARATCVNGAVTLAATSSLANATLTIPGVAPITIGAGTAPNTTVLDAGGIRVVVNEQFSSGGEISVNAIRISFTNVAVGLNLLNGEIIVSRSVTRLEDCSAAAATANLSMTKTDSADPVRVGDTFSYTLTVANAGPDAASSVVATDTLPSNTQVLSATASQGSCGTAGQTVTCNLGTIAASASATVTITVRAISAGVLTNSASATSSTTDPNPNDNTDTETTTAEPATAPPPPPPPPGSSANVTMSKTDSADPVRVGDSFTYTLNVSNAGPDAATSVVATDTVPANAQLLSATSSQGACGTAGQSVTCNLGTIAASASATVTVTVRATAAGVLTNSATASSSTTDPNPNDNTDTETTRVDSDATPPPPGTGADLSMSKTDSADPIRLGDTFTYTLTVSNAGPAAASSVVASDTLPAGLAFVSVTASQGSCGAAGQAVTCNLGTLASAGNATISITVRATAVGVITNTASVRSDTPDPRTDNDTDQETTTVEDSTTPIGASAAAMTIVKTDSADPVSTGDAFSYTIAVSSAGPDAANGVVVRDTLPAGALYVSSTTTQGTCNFASGTVTCDLGTVQMGGRVVVTINVRATGQGELRNVATVTSTTPDPNTADNSDSETTSMQCTASLHTFTPETGFWWNPAEPGTGYNIEIQDHALALTAYVFSASGPSTWFTAFGPMDGDSHFASQLLSFTGGQCLTCNYVQSTQLPSSGPITIDFTSETRGTMTRGGRTIPIERFDFFLTRSAGDAKTEMMLGEWQMVVDSSTCRAKDIAETEHPYFGDVLVLDSVDRAPSPDVFRGCRPTNRNGAPRCDAISRSLHGVAGYFDAVRNANVVVVEDVPAAGSVAASYIVYYLRTGTYQFDGFVESCTAGRCGLPTAVLYPTRGFRTASRNHTNTGIGPSSDSAKHAVLESRGLLGAFLGPDGVAPAGFRPADVRASIGIDVEALSPGTNAMIRAMEAD